MTTDSLPFPTSSTASGCARDHDAALAELTDRDGVSGQREGAAAALGDGGRGELMDRVVRGAHDSIDRLADTAAPHVNRLSQSLNEAGERVNDGAGHVREVGGEWAENLRSMVRDHPLAAVGVALAVGLLVAKLTR